MDNRYCDSDSRSKIVPRHLRICPFDCQADGHTLSNRRFVWQSTNAFMISVCFQSTWDLLGKQQFYFEISVLTKSGSYAAGRLVMRTLPVAGPAIPPVPCLYDNRTRRGGDSELIFAKGYPQKSLPKSDFRLRGAPPPAPPARGLPPPGSLPPLIRSPPGSLHGVP